MSKKTNKETTGREKIHNGLDKTLDFFSTVGGYIAYGASATKDVVKDKANKLYEPLKLKFEADRLVKYTGYGAVIGLIEAKIEKGDEISEVEAYILSKVKNLKLEDGNNSH